MKIDDRDELEKIFQEQKQENLERKKNKKKYTSKDIERAFSFYANSRSISEVNQETDISIDLLKKWRVREGWDEKLRIQDELKAVDISNKIKSLTDSVRRGCNVSDDLVNTNVFSDGEHALVLTPKERIKISKQDLEAVVNIFIPLSELKRLSEMKEWADRILASPEVREKIAKDPNKLINLYQYIEKAEERYTRRLIEIEKEKSGDGREGIDSFFAGEYKEPE